MFNLEITEVCGIFLLIGVIGTVLLSIRRIRKKLSGLMVFLLGAICTFLLVFALVARYLFLPMLPPKDLNN